MNFIEDGLTLDHITVEPRRTATLGDILLGVAKELDALELEAANTAYPLTPEQVEDVTLSLPCLHGQNAIEANQVFSVLGGGRLLLFLSTTWLLDCSIVYIYMCVCVCV